MRVTRIIKIALDIPDDRRPLIDIGAKHKKLALIRSPFVKNKQEILENIPNVACNILALYMTLSLLSILHFKHTDILSLPVFFFSYMGFWRLIRYIAKMRHESVITEDHCDIGLEHSFSSVVNTKFCKKGRTQHVITSKVKNFLRL